MGRYDNGFYRMTSIILHEKTALIQSIPLSSKTGRQIWLKMDCYQPTGSFKIRGIGRLCQYYWELGKKQFVSSSGGNAGLAVSYIARKLGGEALVFVPKTTKPIFLNAIADQGATVRVEGDVWDEANALALQYAHEHDAAYIPPFDHPLIWAGHATLIDEVAASGLKPDAVVASVGGGGLACGILAGMHQHGWFDVPFYGVETEGAASFKASLDANELVTLDKINTIATSLGAKKIAKRLFDWRLEHPIHALTVTDRNTILACQQFANDHRVLVEPASGASLSVIYDQADFVKKYQTILVVVCGGIGLSLELLNDYLNKLR